MMERIKTIDWNTWVPLLTGLAIAAISAWYSILGLAAIFSSAAVSIMIMGAALELGKVVTASYLHRNWKQIPLLVKTYFCIAVIVLMLITSMGTFGYLSRAHIQNSVDSTAVEARIERIDESIEAQQQRVQRAQTVLNQLDAAVDSMIGQDYATRGLSARAAQTEERAGLEATIADAESRIQALLDEKLPLTQQIRSQQSEVGPIRYVAELIYGRSDTELMEKAVRYMIILLVIVFDPLAVLLIMMSTGQTMRQRVVKARKPRQPRAPKPNLPPINKEKVVIVGNDEKWRDGDAPINSILKDVRNSSLQSQ